MCMCVCFEQKYIFSLLFFSFQFEVEELTVLRGDRIAEVYKRANDGVILQMKKIFYIYKPKSFPCDAFFCLTIHIFPPWNSPPKTKVFFVDSPRNFVLNWPISMEKLKVVILLTSITLENIKLRLWGSQKSKKYVF